MFPDPAAPPEAALGFVLDAPLQAWGVESRFQRRGTGIHPSKSALLGLLAAALGIDKHDPAEAVRLEPLRVLRLTTCRVPRGVSDGTDGLAGRLTDYHTIGGGYDTGTDRGYLSTPRKAGGGPFGTVVTQREYLTDAVFVAILTGPRTTLEAASRALENPVWGVWLGRKCCPPATPVRASVSPDVQSALDRCLKNLALPPTGLTQLDRCLELHRGDPGAQAGEAVDAAPDDPVRFGQREHVSRLFVHRRAGQPD